MWHTHISVLSKHQTFFSYRKLQKKPSRRSVELKFNVECIIINAIPFELLLILKLRESHEDAYFFPFCKNCIFGSQLSKLLIGESLEMQQGQHFLNAEPCGQIQWSLTSCCRAPQNQGVVEIHHGGSIVLRRVEQNIHDSHTWCIQPMLWVEYFTSVPHNRLKGAEWVCIV